MKKFEKLETIKKNVKNGCKKTGEFIWEHRGSICLAVGAGIAVVTRALVDKAEERAYAERDMRTGYINNSVADFLAEADRKFDGKTISSFAISAVDEDRLTADDLGRFGDYMKEHGDGFDKALYTHILAFGEPCEDFEDTDIEDGGEE